MKIHTVFITYNRLELTKQAIQSYLDTVSVPYSYVVVDNGSTDGTVEWLSEHQEELGCGVYLVGSNRYPGYAANRGWERMDNAPGFRPEPVTHLHRADNDFVFLPGWCEAVEEAFSDPQVGQVGLRTDREEEWAVYNVGGNNVIRRELWDKGLRYDERPWPEFDPGHTEDSYFSPAVKKMGYQWTRVKRPCIIPISNESLDDPYYVDSWEKRNILGWARTRYGR